MRAVDFFCGGGGMTRGFLDAGIEVVAGIDIDQACKETYEMNNPPATFLNEAIGVYTPEQLESEPRIEPSRSIGRDEDDLVFVGCSPCQYWSGMRTDKTKSQLTRDLLIPFQDFISHFRPGYIVIENVPGILRRETESPLTGFRTFLCDEGYWSIAQDVVDVSNYGVPQTRKRFVLIASRVAEVALPNPVPDAPNKVEDFIGDPKEFPVICDGHKDEIELRHHTTAGLSQTNKARIELTPKDGGSRNSWADTELQLPVYAKNANDPKFGFNDVYGRMAWKRPAPTITTRFYSISNGRFGHPDQDRPISLREGARLQTFENTYGFYAKTISEVARLIGNAVPPYLAKQIGIALLASYARVPKLHESD